MNLERLGRDVRRQQESALDPVRRRTVRDRLLTENDAAPRRPSRWSNVALGTAVAGLALLVWIQWPTGDAPLTFAVAGQPGSREVFVSAPHSHSVPMTFSDGSRVELKRGSSARVDSLTTLGARLRLEHGHADVHVVHRDATQWQVEAGPYTVNVVGTRFSVRWDARSGEFDVAMREGRVEIEGPDGFRTSLEGRERLHRVGRTPRVEAASEVSGEVASEVASEVVGEDVAAEARVQNRRDDGSESASTTAVAESQGARRVSSPRVADWRRLARAADYEAAVEQVDLEVDGLIAGGQEQDLRLLATTLRRAGDAREPRVWQALRGRFADEDAAFNLARHAFHRGAIAESESWLRTYLRESPNGRWEMEARGRLVEVLSQRNAPTAAEAARLYLSRFPEGPHARLAQSLVQP